jgi:hypothetical protein
MNSSENWFEVWAEGRSPTYPPYLLIVRPNPTASRQIEVLDPREGDTIAFSNADYEEVRMWLLEDEFALVTGRMNPND